MSVLVTGSACATGTWGVREASALLILIQSVLTMLGLMRVHVRPPWTFTELHGVRV